MKHLAETVGHANEAFLNSSSVKKDKEISQVKIDNKQDDMCEIDMTLSKPLEESIANPYPTMKTQFGSKKRDRLKRLAESTRSPSLYERL